MGNSHTLAPPLIDRVAAKIDTSGDCWEWTAYRTPKGYGQVWLGDRMWLAHRIVYEALVGPIPDGLQIDHLCRNPGCVNPMHLEPVTSWENSRRGGSFTHNTRKTRCPHGHPYDEANTYRTPGGARKCRTCRIGRH